MHRNLDLTRDSRINNFRNYQHINIDSSPKSLASNKLKLRVIHHT